MTEVQGLGVARAGRSKGAGRSRGRADRFGVVQELTRA